MPTRRKGLTRDKAIYYFMMGKDHFEGTVSSEMANIFMDRDKNTQYTREDKQQLWEVYVELTAQNQNLWRLTARNIPRDENGNPILLNEWTYSLYQYNLTMMTNEWHHITESMSGLDYQMERYQKLYKDYQTKMGRKLYLCLPSKESISGITPISMDMGKFTTEKELSDTTINYYKDVVVYELGESINHYLNHNREPFKNLYSISMEYTQDEGRNATKWFMKGLLMYVDLITGYDWGADWE